jgi:hypothetical protein
VRVKVSGDISNPNVFLRLILLKSKFLVALLMMRMAKDWLQFPKFNLSVTNALLKRLRCKEEEIELFH